MAAADYEAQISLLHEHCRDLEARLHLPGGQGALVDGALTQPLETLISQHRGVLVGPVGAAEDRLSTHPGSTLCSYATRLASGEAGSGTLGLRSYSGDPPVGSLSGFEFWGTDHDAAETQLRSFATAAHLPSLQRLRALHTRDTLERLRSSIAALSARRRLLTAQLALQGAFDPVGVAGQDEQKLSSDAARRAAHRRGCGTERGAWGAVQGDGRNVWAL